MSLPRARGLITMLSLVGAPSAAAELSSPLTQTGAVYPTHARLIDFLASLRPAPKAERLARGVGALATPAATPPAGKIGYYSDGSERVAVAVLSRSARRLFIEFEPGEVARTNVAGFIFGDEDS